MRNSRNFQRWLMNRRAICWTALIALVACSTDSGTGTSTHPVTAVVVTLAAGRLTVGGRTQASAEARDANGAVVAGQTASWASSDASIASVSTAGMVSALKAGTATIVGTVENVSGSANITIATASPPPATKLAIIQQPSSTVQSGVAFAQQPIIQLQDANGSAVSQSGVSITAVVASGGGTLSGTTTVVTNVGGTATFANLGVAGSGAQTLQFNAAGLASATSSTVTIAAPPPVATKLAITTQPAATVTSGAAFNPQPVIQLQDASGNAVSQAGVSVTAAIASGGGTLGGTTTATTSTSGAASFSNLFISGSGAQTLQFTANGLTSVTSSTITVSVSSPVATKLSISTQPGATATSGIALSPQPVIQLQDASGNAVSQLGVAVTVSVASGGGILSGTTTVATNTVGMATFSNLAITGSGAQSLQFSASGLGSVISSTVTVSAPPPVATKLAITRQPGATATSSVALSPQPLIQVQDANGNAVSQSGISVTAAVASGGGTLSGTATVATNANGTATFTNLAIIGSGPQTLRFTAIGLTSVTSSTVTVSVPPPVASKLAITTQPGATATSGATLSPQPVVQLQDASGNAVSQSGVPVTAVVLSGGGTLSGTTTVSTSASGAAAFTTLAITGSGAQTLQFTASGLTSATANAITVTASGTGGGTVLFAENFEDTNFGARGWYDLGGMTSLSTTDHITGSAHSLQVNFPQGALKPSPNVNARHLFTPSDAVYVRYWIKHSTNWVGSGHTYHPHEFYLLSTLDDQYAGPSVNYLDVYIEDNWMSDGGHPLLQSQDAQNIDTTRINQDLTAITENRAVSGCNGNPDNTTEISCYQSGSWNNVKVWRSALPAFVDATGPNYKGDWHKVEAYYKLNSIVNGKAQNDGVAQYWVDGVLYIDRHDLQFRTGAHPTLQFNQFIMSPYIGDGSPVAQSLWYDDLVVMTAPPGS